MSRPDGGLLPGPEMEWVTADRRRIPVRKLDDEHLVNIMRMLRYRAMSPIGEQFGPRPQFLRSPLDALLKEVLKRGLTEQALLVDPASHPNPRDFFAGSRDGKWKRKKLRSAKTRPLDKRRTR